MSALLGTAVGDVEGHLVGIADEDVAGAFVVFFVWDVFGSLVGIADMGD